MIQLRISPDGDKPLSMSWWESPLAQRRIHRQTEGSHDPNSGNGAEHNQNLRHDPPPVRPHHNNFGLISEFCNERNGETANEFPVIKRSHAAPLPQQIVWRIGGALFRRV